MRHDDAVDIRLRERLARAPRDLEHVAGREVPARERRHLLDVHDRHVGQPGHARDELLAKIKVALGGRAAEKVVYGDLTTGAESDIQNLTQVARGMVGRWGMSDALGPIAVLPQDGATPFLPGGAEAAERTQELIDREVRRIVDEAHEEATGVLRDNRDKLDALAHALLEKETLDEDEAYAAAGMGRPPAEEREPAQAPAGI